MFFLLFLVVLFICYVTTFKEEFKEEDLEKAYPFIIICSLILVIVGILGSI